MYCIWLFFKSIKWFIFEFNILKTTKFWYIVKLKDFSLEYLKVIKQQNVFCKVYKKVNLPKLSELMRILKSNKQDFWLQTYLLSF